MTGFVSVREIGNYIKEALQKAFPNLKLSEGIVKNYCIAKDFTQKQYRERYSLFEKRDFSKRELFTINSSYYEGVCLSVRELSIESLVKKALKSTKWESLVN